MNTQRFIWTPAKEERLLSLRKNLISVKGLADYFNTSERSIERKIKELKSIS